MELEKQVCSLELAQKLKELGVKQESLFWCINDNIFYKTNLGAYRDDGAAINERLFSTAYKLSAFTAAELGELMKPYYIVSAWSEIGQRFVCKLMEDTDGHLNSARHQFLAETEADSRALMLIYLVENNLIQ